METFHYKNNLPQALFNQYSEKNLDALFTKNLNSQQNEGRSS